MFNDYITNCTLDGVVGKSRKYRWEIMQISLGSVDLTEIYLNWEKNIFDREPKRKIAVEPLSGLSLWVYGRWVFSFVWFPF